MKRINEMIVRSKIAGFTLVELMAVIVIILLVAILTYPNIINQIKKTKKINSKNINTVVIEVAKKYVRDNKEDYENIIDSCLPVTDLVKNDYIKSDVVTIKDNDMIKKYVKIVRDDELKYSIVDECKSITILDYIDSTGKEYIDTGFKPNQDTRVRAKFYINEPGNYSNRQLFSARQNNRYYGESKLNNDSYNGIFNDYYGTKFTNLYANDIKVFNPIYDPLVYPLTIEIYKNKNVSYYNVNGYKGMFARDYINFQLDYTMYIFCANHTGRPYELSNLRFYYLKLYDNKKLIRDYIPVLDYDGIPCLYDKVEGKFYYNIGTGGFLYEE